MMLLGTLIAIVAFALWVGSRLAAIDRQYNQMMEAARNAPDYFLYNEITFDNTTTVRQKTTACYIAGKGEPEQREYRVNLN